MPTPVVGPFSGSERETSMARTSPKEPRVEERPFLFSPSVVLSVAA
jgi:hypothetical protein